MKQGFIYIMSNKGNSVLYTGVSSNLSQCVFQHKNKLIDGFTKKYNLTKLVYYEVCDSIMSAISREKQIKGGSRIKKIALIEKENPNWEDLYNEL